MSRIRPTRIVAFGLVLVLLASACAGGEEQALISSGNDPVTAPRDLIGTAEEEGLTSLVAAIEASGLEETLSGDGPFTLFAPTDDAFGNLPDGLLEALSEDANSDLLDDILSYHVLEGRQLAPDLLETSQVETLEGSRLTIDAVEIPPNDPEGDPTTDIQVGDQATATTVDLLATNGVVHLIDAVLIPEDRADDLQQVIDEIPETTDVLSTLENSGGLNEFLEGLETVGLAEELQGDGPFTVFAPTDAAFGALTASQDQLLRSNPDLYETILGFHIIEGTALTADVFTARRFETLSGEGAMFSRTVEHPEIDEDAPEDEDPDPPQVYFTYEGVELSSTDIEATNGVIHIIDAIVVPDSARGPGGF